jgi:hypothetical protein
MPWQKTPWATAKHLAGKYPRATKGIGGGLATLTGGKVLTDLGSNYLGGGKGDPAADKKSPSQDITMPPLPDFGAMGEGIKSHLGNSVSIGGHDVPNWALYGAGAPLVAGGLYGLNRLLRGSKDEEEEKYAASHFVGNGQETVRRDPEFDRDAAEFAVKPAAHLGGTGKHRRGNKPEPTSATQFANTGFNLRKNFMTKNYKPASRPKLEDANAIGGKSMSKVSLAALADVLIKTSAGKPGFRPRPRPKPSYPNRGQGGTLGGQRTNSGMLGTPYGQVLGGVKQRAQQSKPMPTSSGNAALAKGTGNLLFGRTQYAGQQRPQYKSKMMQGMDANKTYRSDVGPVRHAIFGTREGQIGRILTALLGGGYGAARVGGAPADLGLFGGHQKQNADKQSLDKLAECSPLAMGFAYFCQAQGFSPEATGEAMTKAAAMDENIKAEFVKAAEAGLLDPFVKDAGGLGKALGGLGSAILKPIVGKATQQGGRLVSWAAPKAGKNLGRTMQGAGESLMQQAPKATARYGKAWEWGNPVSGKTALPQWLTMGTPGLDAVNPAAWTQKGIGAVADTARSGLSSVGLVNTPFQDITATLQSEYDKTNANAPDNISTWEGNLGAIGNRIDAALENVTDPAQREQLMQLKHQQLNEQLQHGKALGASPEYTARIRQRMGVPEAAETAPGSEEWRAQGNTVFSDPRGLSSVEFDPTTGQPNLSPEEAQSFQTFQDELWSGKFSGGKVPLDDNLSQAGVEGDFISFPPPPADADWDTYIGAMNKQMGPNGAGHAALEMRSQAEQLEGMLESGNLNDTQKQAVMQRVTMNKLLSKGIETGRDPRGVAERMWEDQNISEEEWAEMQTSKGFKELVGQFGDPSAAADQVGQMDIGQQMALWGGLGLAAIGAITAIAGGSPVMGIMMTMLGLGAAFGFGGAGDMIGGLMGGFGGGGEQPPAQPPAQGQPPGANDNYGWKPEPGVAPPGPDANPMMPPGAETNAVGDVPKEIAFAEDGIDANELAAMQKDPAKALGQVQQLAGLPLEQLSAMLQQTPPEIKQQMSSLLSLGKSSLKGKIPPDKLQAIEQLLAVS